MATTNDFNDPLTSILGSQYEIDKGIELIASNFFEEADKDTMNVGLYGWLRTVQAHHAKQFVYQRNFMYREYAINSARLPSTIFSRAVDYGVVIDRAKPAIAKAVLIIDFDSVIKDATAVGNNYIFKMKREDINFRMESFVFMLPHTIAITIDTLNYTAISTYDIESEKELELGRINLYKKYPYLRTVTKIDEGSGKKLIYIDVDLYQMNYVERTFEVFSNNISDRILFDMTFTDQLVDFIIEYTSAAGVTEHLNVYLNNRSSETNEKYALYNYTSDKSLQIFFPTISGDFQPEFNSSLKVKIFTTQGAQGNFNYTGKVSIGSFSRNNSYIFSDLFFVQLTSQPTLGKDTPDINSIKSLLLKRIKRVDALATPNDLQSYFSQVIDENSLDAKVQFIKSQDDVLKRQFLGYLMIKDDNGHPIQTNTVNLSTSLNELSLNNYVSKAGTVVYYDIVKNVYRFLSPTEYPDEMVNKGNSFLYATPFIMKLEANPFPRISVYNTVADSNSQLKYKFVGVHEKSDQFIFNYVDIKKDNIYSNFYDVQVKVSSDFTAIQVASLRMFAIYLDSDTSIPIGYQEMKASDDLVSGYFFNSQLSSNLSFDATNNLVITNSLKNLTTSQLLTTTAFPERIKIQVGVFETTANGNIAVSPIPDNSLFSIIPELNGFEFLAITETETDLQLFKSYNESINVELIIKNDGSVLLKGVPLVGVQNFFNSSKYKSFTTQLNFFIDEMKTVFAKIRNNTQVSLKFFNTYGISHHFSSEKVNISLKFQIATNITFNKDLDVAIKKTIVQYIYDCNKINNEEFSVSNLTTLIENTHVEVRKVRITAMNGTLPQDIVPIYTKEELEERYILEAPEFLTASFKAYDNGINILTPDIEIVYS